MVFQGLFRASQRSRPVTTYLRAPRAPALLAPITIIHPPALSRSPPPSGPARPLSSLGDSLSDLLHGGGTGKVRSPRIDELSTRRFRVTRLNDVLASGLSDVVEAAAGPASAEACRNEARFRRSARRWADLLGSVPVEGGRRDRAAAALDRFEAKEVERMERLGGVMDKWRETKLGAKDPTEQTFGERFLKMFRWNRAESPEKTLALRLKNENELLLELRRCDADTGVVREVLRGAGVDFKAAAHASQRKKKDQKTVDAPTAAKQMDKVNFVYVLDFRGDSRATQTSRLAEEISALLSLQAEFRPSEVVLRLNSPGGTVTGYGLATAQLMRLVNAKGAGGAGGKIRLTVCVDEVAASGGYLMACTGTQILCSPFAAIGSIGVVASSPNVAKRLESEGVSVVQKTAGKYKRTVTPWREPRPEELEKMQSDVDDIQKHFVGHVLRRRGGKLPGGVEEVATGEVWFGEDALKRGLVDELMTSEEYIQSKIQDGCEVLQVRRVSGRMGLPSFWGGGVDEEEVMRLISPILGGTSALPSLDSNGDAWCSENALFSEDVRVKSRRMFEDLLGLSASRRIDDLLEALSRSAKQR